MTDFMQLLREKANEAPRKRPAHMEHDIQVACVRWFRLSYPSLAHALFAVPNGGRRDKTTGAMLKAEGALRGVADLILLHPSGKFGALLIEMKTPDGRQSAEQRNWQECITKNGDYKYIVCHGIDEFIEHIKKYINEQD